VLDSLHTYQILAQAQTYVNLPADITDVPLLPTILKWSGLSSGM